MLSTQSNPQGAAQRFGAGAQVAVLLPLPVTSAYDYKVPEGVELSAGDIVEVPLGRRFEVGVVWGPGQHEVRPEKLREIVHRLDVPPVPEVSRRFIDWAAAYTLQSPGALLRIAINPARRWVPPQPVSALAASGLSLKAAGVKATPAREKVMAAIGAATFPTATALAAKAGVSSGVIRQLIDAGALRNVPLPYASPFDPLAPDHARPCLEAAQAEAAAVLVSKVGEGFSATVLDGVTGSGKTEVYFEAVAAALKTGRQALILLPEIALTAQSLARFAA
ncbi:MAG: DEAD/DEAH box helicase, partial [Hyphomonas sp.]|nr:DEAD/DEAH box helicase [Hyphomonas sp.]